MMVATDFTSLPKPSLVFDHLLRTRTFRHTSFKCNSTKRNRPSLLTSINHDREEKSSVDDDARSIRMMVQQQFGRENDVTAPLVRVLG